MRLIARRMRGMQDVLPGEIEKWEYIEKVMKEQADRYGFRLIRTPAIEATGLFKRENGQASDMVDKEMYTFEDKGGRNVSLRPEGTAGVVRAVLENGLHNQGLPLKLMYISSCYRYEKPQNGRLREFFQFGMEIIGGNATMADAEIMELTASIFKKLGLTNIRPEINAICCEGCQPMFIRHIREHFKEHEDKLCETCKSRLDRSPLRIFDCKNNECRKVAYAAPNVLEYLCKDCAEHFQRLKDYTYISGLNPRVNPYLFRGLDYYTKSVFEFVDYTDDCNGMVLCGGGRYDYLAKEIGGQKIMSVGVGIGMERLLYIMEKQGVKFPEHKPCDIYIGALGAKARLFAVKVSKKLRDVGVRAEIDLVGRFIKPQMRYANKIKAKFVIIMGVAEMNSKQLEVKNMATGQVIKIKVNKDFISNLRAIVRGRPLKKTQRQIIYERAKGEAKTK